MSGFRRNNKVDNLRCLGILLIILAHCGAPLTINNIRCFDVILLVFLSAYMYKDFDELNKSSYLLFLQKKAKRLLLPTYFFIAVFSQVLFWGYRFVGRAELFGTRQLINSFLLCEDSVGYVWIMKVYFINALLAPFIVRLQKKTHSDGVFFFSIIIQFCLYEVLVKIYTILELNNYYVTWIIINEWLICCFAYGIVGQIALWHKKSQFWQKNGWIIWGGIVILTVCLSAGFDTVAGKRPPNLMYLSWGMFCSELLFKVIPNKEFALCKWISCHSMELYLIHPVFILLFSLGSHAFGLDGTYGWLVEWPIVLIGTGIVVLLMNIVFTKIRRNKV